MATRETRAPRRLAMPAAALIGALALAGCSSGNIGESWQCPLAKGGSCDSVAAADPAVPDAQGAGTTILAEPLWHERNGDRAGPPPDTEAACASDCGAGFDPLAWLARLFQADPGSQAGESDDGGTSRSPDTGSPPTEAAGAAAQTTAAPISAGGRPAEPSTDALPVEQLSLQPEPAAAGDDPQADDLRTGEVVARIWIAPFVDADGIYREASYIRVVLEPAGWRLK